MVDPRALGLQVSRRVGNEFQCRCPYHKDSHPSATFNPRKGVLYCFTCSKSWGAGTIANDLGGTVVIVDRIDDSELDSIGEEIDWRKLVDLPSAADHPYIKKRGIPDRIAALLNVRGDDKRVVFPFYNSLGNLIGAQTRSVEGKEYRFYGERPALWPCPVLWPGRNVFLVEGVFGAMRGLIAGPLVFSTLGAGSVHKALDLLPDPEHTYAVFDDDPAGWTASAKALAHGVKILTLKGFEADESPIELWQKIMADPSHFFSGDIYKLVKHADVKANKGITILSNFKKEQKRVSR